jgi:hypothetical protein
LADGSYELGYCYNLIGYNLIFDGQKWPFGYKLHGIINRFEIDKTVLEDYTGKGMNRDIRFYNTKVEKCIASSVPKKVGSCYFMLKKGIIFDVLNFLGNGTVIFCTHFLRFLKPKI